MKKLFILSTLFVGLSFAPAYAGEVGTDTVLIEQLGEVVPPDYNEDVVLPDVEWGLDFHYYFMSWWIYIATILAITQTLKKLFNWQDNKAYWLSLAVAAIMAGAGFYFKLGMLALAPWYVAIGWFVAFVIGSKLGYRLMEEFANRLGIGTQK